MNVGIYRGMIGQKDTTPFLLIKGGQHWGHHFVKYGAPGSEPMPVACVIGWDPIMPFLAGSPIPTGVCEWDVMGALSRRARRAGALRDGRSRGPRLGRDRARGRSSATIPRPTRRRGRSASSPATSPTSRRRGPTMKVTCITHRRDPIFRGCLEGTLPGSYSENSVMSVGAARGHRLEHPERRGHPGHPRRVRAAHHQRREHPSCRSRSLPGPAQADRRRAVGQQRRPVPLQARDRGGGRHRSRRPTSRWTGPSPTG